MSDFRPRAPQPYLEQDRLHNKWLHGSGTVQGLHVAVQGNLVRVTPGLAVDAAGRVLRVEGLYEGSLQGWLDRYQREGRPLPAPDADGNLLLYVTLTADGSATGWRLAGALPPEQGKIAGRATSSCLRFAEAPPRQDEAPLDKLLDHLQLTDEPGNLDAPRAVRLITGRDQLGNEPLLLNRAQAEAVLTALLEAWITQARPTIPAFADDGVLLASIRFRVRAGRVEDVTVSAAGRPLLGHVRLLQSWLLRLGLAPGDAVAPAPVDPAIVRRTDPVEGDLAGSVLRPVVQALQGRALSDAEPPDQALLAWSQATQRWQPMAMRAAAPFATITRMRQRNRTLYELWLHVPGEADCVVRNPPSLSIYAEGDRERRRLWEGALVPAGRNRFRAEVDAWMDGYRHLQFVLRLTDGWTQDGRSLLEMARTSRFAWMGHDGEETVVIPFYANPALTASTATPWDEAAAGEDPLPPRKKPGPFTRFFRWFFGLDN